MPRLIRIFTFAALAMLVLALPSSSLARKSHGKKHKVAHKSDRNRDGLPDRWEKAHKLSLKVNQSGRDQDRDGANNAAEYAAHTNPRNCDSDHDGIKDGKETVGTIASFTDGILVITTAAGLIVAIPALFAYRYLRGVVDLLVVDMEKEAMKLVRAFDQMNSRSQPGARRREAAS